MRDSSVILDYWHERLINWTLYRLSGNSCGVSSAYDGVWNEGAPRPPLPLVGEALDTDDLILKLSQEHKDAIVTTYVWSVPERLEDRARLMGIHRDTLSDRVRAAKFRLDDMHHARKRACAKVAEAMRVAA